MKRIIFVILFILAFTGCDYSNLAGTIDSDIPIIISDSFTTTTTTSALSQLQEFMKQHSITLTAEDVQYDMVNNLDKYFVIEGNAELSDYFNYGFDNEEFFYSIFVIPDGGNYSDGWYLYLNRTDFKQLYDDLKQGNINIISKCIIDKRYYEKNQGNMALVETVIW